MAFLQKEGQLKPQGQLGACGLYFPTTQKNCLQ